MTSYCKLRLHCIRERVRRRSTFIIGAGTARLNFNFNRYSTKDDITNAITSLPAITGSGSAVAEAMELLKDSVFQSCPITNGSQCVAMILYDQNEDNRTAVKLLAQVSRQIAAMLISHQRVTRNYWTY